MIILRGFWLNFTTSQRMEAKDMKAVTGRTSPSMGLNHGLLTNLLGHFGQVFSLGFLVFYHNPRSLIFSLKFKDFKKTLNLRLLPGSGWLKLSMYHFKARHSWGSMESWVENFSLHWRLVTIFSQFSNKNALKWCLKSRHFRFKWSDFDFW